MSRLVWRGRKVADKARRAEVKAVQETIDSAASEAAGRRSGRTASITSEPVTKTGTGVRGRWGVFPEPHGGSLFFELFFETGTAFIPGDNAKRQAADTNYRSLARKIREGLRG